jgi:hypothetical protein
VTLTSPWPALDTHLTLEPGDLIVITGPGSSGVSMAALNFAIHAAFEQDAHSEVFSMEITSKGTMERVLANRARIDSTHFHYTDRLTDDEYERIDAVRQNCDDIPLWALTGPFTVDSIRQVFREHVDRGDPLRLAVADGLNLVDAEPRWSSANTAKAARALKAIAREFGVVFLATVHGEVEGSGRKTKWGVDADVVDAADKLLILEPHGDSCAELRVAKGSSGSAWAPVDLLWEPRYSTFSERKSDSTAPVDDTSPSALSLHERVEARMAEIAARANDRPVSTPWPDLDDLLNLRYRSKVGVVAQRGTHEATIGRRIAAHAAQEGPVLLFTGFPPDDVPDTLVIDPEPTPTPQQVNAAALNMFKEGRAPRLVVVERYERMRLSERGEEDTRADELEQCGQYLGWHTEEWDGCPVLLTTVVDQEPELHRPLPAWSGVNSPASIMSDFCRTLAVLRRADAATVMARMELEDTGYAAVQVHDVAWPNARFKVETPARPVPAPALKPAPILEAATISGAVQALETEYAGHRFRSRLEARWAVFFDTLGVQWEYEPERYQLPSGKYLPDFWLPKQKMFFEVKGVAPTGRYTQLLDELAVGTRNRVVLAVGSIPRPDRFEIGADGQSDFWMEVYDGSSSDGSGEAAWDNYQAWTLCPKCGAFDVCFEARGCRTYCGCSTGNCNCGSTPVEVLEAFRAARSARFEHGESGA